MIGKTFLLLALLLLPPAAAAVTLSLDGDMIGPLGAEYETRHEDTLAALARRFDLGFVELRAANAGVDAWLPGAGVRLALPTAHLLPTAPRHGIVINIGDQRLYHFIDGAGTVATYPVGTPQGKCGMPLGQTRIVGKRVNPVWVPPPSIRAERPDLPAAVPPGPDNPLGGYALDLGWPAHVIHGTNKPLGVGRRVSHGCIRMYPEDIKELFVAVAVGTRVTVVDEAVKVGWRGTVLYVEAHPTPDQADEIEIGGRFTPTPADDLAVRIGAAAGAAAARVDWPALERAARERRGVPVPITDGDDRRR